MAKTTLIKLVAVATAAASVLLVGLGGVDAFMDDGHDIPANDIPEAARREWDKKRQEEAAKQHVELQQKLRRAKARDSSPEEKAAARQVAVLDSIKNSDDFGLHRDAFVKATRLFLQKGGSLADLREEGGWVRSPRHKPRRVYFTYRRTGTHVRDRFYFDVDSGKLHQ